MAWGAGAIIKELLYYQKDIHLNHLNCGYIGEGHTARWCEHRRQKSQPINLSDWPLFDYNLEEKIPFVQELQQEFVCFLKETKIN